MHRRQRSPAEAAEGAAPEPRLVPVRRVVEKVVVQKVAYDRAKIDAALRSHGQQPPR